MMSTERDVSRHKSSGASNLTDEALGRSQSAVVAQKKCSFEN